MRMHTLLVVFQWDKSGAKNRLKWQRFGGKIENTQEMRFSYGFWPELSEVDDSDALSRLDTIETQAGEICDEAVPLASRLTGTTEDESQSFAIVSG